MSPVSFSITCTALLTVPFPFPETHLQCYFFFYLKILQHLNACVLLRWLVFTYMITPLATATLGSEQNGHGNHTIKYTLLRM